MGQLDRSKTMFPDLLCDDVFRLETARLWLRWPRMADAAALVRHAGVKQIADMTTSIPHPYGVQDAEKFIFSCRAGNARGQQIALVLTLKGKAGQLTGGQFGEAIGVIGLHETRPGHALFGYWLGQPWHNLGLMSEASQALLKLAFCISPLQQVSASVQTGNPASRRVLEKSGFILKGTGPVDVPLRGGILQCDRFMLDREGWQTRHAQAPETGGETAFRTHARPAMRRTAGIAQVA